MSAADFHDSHEEAQTRADHSQELATKRPVHKESKSRISKSYRVQRPKKGVRRVAMNEQQRLSICRTNVQRIYAMLRSTPQQWRDYLSLGRMTIAHLDATTFMQQSSNTEEQIWIITALQQLAFVDVESGSVADISAWCSRRWLDIQQRDPQNVASLSGLGKIWLSRAQPALARIHRTEISSISSAGSHMCSTTSPTSADDDRGATIEADWGTDTGDYVEARGFLQPATEYLERAVVASTEQGVVSGDLLAIAAEAQISLGHCTSPRANEQQFRRALELLRAAIEIPGYELSPFFLQYLEDYGRLVD